MSEALVPYNDMIQMSRAIATSGLFGIKTPEQALALMLLAQAEGLHPAVAARDYDIIQGRPAKKSEAMLRSFIASGGTVQWHELTDTKAEATFSHPAGGTIKLDWTIERATKAGLTQKQNRDGSPNMYTKYPRQMLRSRLVSEGVRTICPAATSGMYVPEEIHDGETDTLPNIETQRRKGVGWSRAEEPKALTQGEVVELPPPVKPPLVETQPGVYEPILQESDPPVVALFKRIESCPNIDALKKLKEEVKTVQFSDDDKATAVALLTARYNQLTAVTEESII